MFLVMLVAKHAHIYATVYRVLWTLSSYIAIFDIFIYTYIHEYARVAILVLFYNFAADIEILGRCIYPVTEIRKVLNTAK